MAGFVMKKYDYFIIFIFCFIIGSIVSSSFTKNDRPIKKSINENVNQLHSNFVRDGVVAADAANIELSHKIMCSSYMIWSKLASERIPAMVYECENEK